MFAQAGSRSSGPPDVCRRYFINSAILSFTTAPQMSYPFATGCKLSGRNVPGSKYPRVQNCVISPANQSGMSIVKHDDVCGLPRSKTTSAHRIEAESLRTAYAGHLEQATAG